MKKNVPFYIKFLLVYRTTLSVIIWIYFITSLIFSSFFVLSVDFDDITLDKDALEGEGRIIKKEFTNSYSDDMPIYKYIFTYSINGRKYQGVSYTTILFNKKDIIIEYLPYKPSVARIKGATKGNFEPILLLILIIPFSGLLSLYIIYKRNVKDVNLLRKGKLTQGFFDRKEATGDEVNEEPVYRFIYKFDVNGKQYEASGKTHKIEKISENEPADIIFDPEKPNHAVVVNMLPKRVRNFIYANMEK